jgi:plastocyanin
MKNSHLIGIIIVLSFLLVLAGCGGKKTISSPVTATPKEEVKEPELPTEGVQNAGKDITEEKVAPVETPPVETPPAENISEPVSPVEPEETTENTTVPTNKTITMENYRIISFKDLKVYPEEVHIKVGSTVEWRNVNDNLLHIIGWNGQKQAGVKPEPIKMGESWSYTFTTPGKIVWFSTAHPSTQGTIYVEE